MQYGAVLSKAAAKTHIAVFHLLAEKWKLMILALTYCDII